MLQIVSNLGYILLTYIGVHIPAMLAAMAFETVTTGLGMGAFGVLLLRMTRREFSATQYALFSSLFALPRILGGPITGYLVHAFGWRTFFWITIAAGLPGLVALAGVMPWGRGEPRFEVRPAVSGSPVGRGGLLARGLVGGLIGWAIAQVSLAGVRWLSALPDDPSARFVDALGRSLALDGWQAGLSWLATLAFGLALGLLVAAVAASRSGSPAR